MGAQLDDIDLAQLQDPTGVFQPIQVSAPQLTKVTLKFWLVSVGNG